MKTLKEISKDIRNKGLDPFNLKNLLDEIKNQKLNVDKNEISDFLSLNRSFGYHTTPNEISWLMAKIGELYNPKNIADLSCGLGNIIFYCDYCENKVGYEIDKNISNITKYLFPELEIINTDSLSYNYKTTYSAIISHFPFGGRYKQNGRKHNLETLFIKKSMELLNPNGVLICLIPDSFLANHYSDKLKEQIVKNYNLKSIISLQVGFFQNTSIKTSILTIEKTNKSNKTQYIEYSSANETLENFKNGTNSFFVKKSNLKERWDINYHHPKNKEFEIELDKFQTKTIGELTGIIIGFNQTRIRKTEGEYLLLHPKNMKDGKIVNSKKDYFIDYNDLYRRTNTIIEKGDIIIPRIYNDFNRLYIHSDTSLKIVAGPHTIILRSENSEYLSTYLNTKEGRELFNQQIKRNLKGVMPLISISDIRAFRIPILPIENLNTLSIVNLETKSEKELNLLKEQLETHKNKVQNLKDENLVLKSRLSVINKIISKIDEVLENQETIKQKIDEVLVKLQTINDEFKCIKELPRDDETKILRMQKQLDEKLSKLISQNTDINNYVQEIKIWLEFWDVLEVKSKEFIPQAEYLLDQLSKLENADFSPFIIQYSRALENEILIKLFSSYHSYLISNNIDRVELTKNEFDNKNTILFAKSVKNDNRKYAFGTMLFIIGLIKNEGKTLSKSELLQHFKEFAITYFETNVLEKKYLSKLKELVDDYRNKAAHPNIITQEKAMRFHKLIKECLIEFIDGYKK